MTVCEIMFDYLSLTDRGLFFNLTTTVDFSSRNEKERELANLLDEILCCDVQFMTSNDDTYIEINGYFKLLFSSVQELIQGLKDFCDRLTKAVTSLDYKFKLPEVKLETIPRFIITPRGEHYVICSIDISSHNIAFFYKTVDNNIESVTSVDNDELLMTFVEMVQDLARQQFELDQRKEFVARMANEESSQ